MSKRSARAKPRADRRRLSPAAVALAPEAGSSLMPPTPGVHATVAEENDTIAGDALPPVQPTRPESTRPTRRPRWVVAVLLAWAALAVADIAFFHSSLGTNPSRTSRAAAAGAATHRPAQAPVPVP